MDKLCLAKRFAYIGVFLYVTAYVELWLQIKTTLQDTKSLFSNSVYKQVSYSCSYKQKKQIKWKEKDLGENNKWNPTWVWCFLNYLIAFSFSLRLCGESPCYFLSKIVGDFWTEIESSSSLAVIVFLICS